MHSVEELKTNLVWYLVKFASEELLTENFAGNANNERPRLFFLNFTF